MNRQTVKLVRQSYNMNTKEFADLIGVGLSTYQQYESGYSNSLTVPKAVMNTIPNKIIQAVERLLKETETA